MILNRIERFHNAIWVWIHKWPQSDSQSLKGHRRSVLLFFKAFGQIPRPHGLQNSWFGSDFGISRWQLQFEFMDGYEMTHIASKSTEELPYCFLRSTVKFRVHTGWKINLDLIWDYKASHSYSIFQNQGTPFSSCLADATRRLVLPGVASACLALRCLAKQDEPRLMLSAGSDIWLLAQVL